MKKLVLLFAALLVAGCGEKSSSEGSESASENAEPSADAAKPVPAESPSEEPSDTPNSLSDADVEKLPEEAALSVSEIRTIAVGGDAEAQFLLGFMYAKGRGVLEDDKEAVKWFRKAAEQGHAEAQFNLGLTLGL